MTLPIRKTSEPRNPALCISRNGVQYLRLSLMVLFLRASLSATGASISPLLLAAPRQRVIRLDLRHPGPPFRSLLNICIGGEHGALELNTESLRQAALAKSACGFQYIRFHGILDPDMHAVVREAGGKLIYNWSKIDRLYSQLLASGLKPLVEISYMPVALASGSRTIFYYKGNVSLPKSFVQWGKFIKAFVIHLEGHFGRRQVRTWYFEVWNEPNNHNFFNRGLKNYVHVYGVTARAVKQADPALRVGGPATAGLGWIRRFIAACVRQKLPLDFISTHTYGCGPHVFADGQRGLMVDGRPNAIAGGINWTFSRIKRSAMPHLPLLITEWGPSYSSRDAVHDTYFQAVWLLEQMQSLRQRPLLMSYWALSDIFDEHGPQTAAFEGGFGIFNPQGLKKPTFFALKYLHQLMGRQLRTGDEHSIATINHGRVSLLAWSYHWPKQTAPDNAFFRRPYPSQPARFIMLEVRHIKPGHYHLRIHRVGYRHNDAYTLYQRFGYPTSLSPQQLATMRAATSNRPCINKMIKVHSNHSWRYRLAMRTNGIVLLQLIPVDR